MSALDHSYLFDPIEQVRAENASPIVGRKAYLEALRRMVPVPRDYSLREIDIFFSGLLQSDKINYIPTGAIQAYRDEVVATILDANARVGRGATQAELEVMSQEEFDRRMLMTSVVPKETTK